MAISLEGSSCYSKQWILLSSERVASITTRTTNQTTYAFESLRWCEEGILNSIAT